MKRIANFLVFKFLILTCLLHLNSTTGFAQLNNWRFEMPVTITNISGNQLSNYPALIILNTSALVSAGYMKPDGSDMRFASGCGTGLLQYCIENYMNTDTTRVWVKIASLAPYTSATLYMFMGNPSAVSASSLSLFEGVYSSTNYVSVSQSSSVSNCQRGFRFTPTKDMLVTHLGKRVPNSTARYVTIFDAATQQIVTQVQVSAGTPGVYNYDELTRPVWLEGGHQYIIQVFSGPGDNYYFGISSQVGQYLIYHDMRYENNCNQNTFPTQSYPNLHFGTPDFLYYVRQTPVSPEPTYSFGQIADTNTPAPPINLTAVAGNQQAFLTWSKNTEFDISKYYVYMNTTNNRNTAQLVGSNVHPDTTYTVTNLVNGTTYYFWVRAGDRFCIERISDFSNVAVISPLNVPLSEQLPVEFDLYQNYPNPFNPVTDIKYDIPKETFVKLVIYDLLGRVVSVLVSENQKPGKYSAKWQAADVPSGVYIYRLTAGEFEKTFKMVLLK